MSKSTRKARRRKAPWQVAGFRIERPPRPEFPLSPHASGKWQKRIRGEVHYFGQWARREKGQLVRIEGDGWEEAWKLYKLVAEDLYAGRTPRVKGEGLTVKDLGDRFLTAKHHKLASGELGARMFEEYRQTCQLLADTFGKNRLVSDLAADSFERLRADLAKRYGPVRLGNEIQKVRTVFKYALGQGLIDKPVQLGDEFKKPSKRDLRVHRAKQGKRLFTAEELRTLIDAAGVPLKAMILLGVNAAFGNADCGQLPRSALDLERGWADFARPKTGIERRAALWPETVEALRAALAKRPEPKDEANAGLAFITKYGKPWATGGTSDAVTQEMGKLLKALGINGRVGLGFYALRHTFRTVADATRDFPAVRLVMGHADDSIDAVYREGIDDSRLRAVADHVRRWLWPDRAEEPEGEENLREVYKRAAKLVAGQPAAPVATLRLYAG